MFFKSSDNRTSAETSDSALFSMERIGLQIMRARKKKGMTQMELADRMGISFQAVSNWERGQSCPDIARLFELSELFDVSIDELLGNPRAVKIATEVMDGTTPALPVEELAEVAPLLDQKQADDVIRESLAQKGLPEQPQAEDPPAPEQAPVSAKERMEGVLSLLPYASEATVAALAKATLKETHNAALLEPFLVYMGENDVAALAKETLQETRDPGKLAPFLIYLNEGDVSEIAQTVFRETQDPRQIAPFLIYMEEKDVGALAKEIYRETRDPRRLEPLLFSMDESDVNEIAREVLKETRDPKRIEPFLPYMDEDDVDALLRSLLS